MNSRQLQYALALAEVRNFSQLAEKLNITQPALSKQILALERELGIKLFDRNTSPLSLTPAGEYYLREARELLYKEEQLSRALEQFKSGEQGRLTIGTTYFRASYLIPPLARKLQEQYPKVQLRLIEAGSEVLRREMADGKYDFAIINLPVNESVLEVTPLEPDQLGLAVTKELLPPEWEAREEISFAECKALPFVVASSGQEMRSLFDHLCAASGVRPTIAAEVIGLNTAFAMARAGIGAVLHPLQFLREQRSEMKLLKLQDAAISRRPAIVTRKGQYLSPYAKYAMEVLQK